jgi:hypothetical protein
MVELFRPHALYEADVVRHAGKLRQMLANPSLGLAVLGKSVLGPSFRTGLQIDWRFLQRS